jgi:phosphate-selective porin OprO and OprP
MEVGMRRGNWLLWACLAGGLLLTPLRRIEAQELALPIAAEAVSQLELPTTDQTRINDIEKRLDELDVEKKKLPNVSINGVFQADGVWFNQTDESRDQFGSIESGADFRRARLSAKGSVVESMNYFMQMDFGFFGRPTFTDVWVEQNEVPVLGNVRVGQWKQPFSLEVASSFRYTTFMERSPLFQTFTPFRGIGVGFYDHSENLSSTWAASYFRTGQDQFGGSLSTNGGNGMAARLTHLFWYGGDKGRDYLHVGTGYFLRTPPRETARFRSVPEIFVGEFAPGTVGTSGQAVPGAFNGTPFFVDTGVLTDVSDIRTFGLESLWVRGPLSFQTEGMAAVVDQAAPNALLSGAYGQVGYFLTGEHRPYDRKSGAIDRVMPHASIGKGGCGAWEVAGRFSFIDLSDETIQGGQMKNVTAGINWYINPYCKWVINYIHSWTDGPDHFPTRAATTIASQTDVFATRVQLDF